MERNKITKRLLLKKVRAAIVGTICWNRYYMKYGRRERNCIFLLVPRCSDRELYYLMLYYKKLSDDKKRIVLLAEDERAYEWLWELSSGEMVRKKVTSKKMEKLLLAFPHIWLQNQIVVASLSLPIGRQGEHLLDKDSITFEELFATAVLKIKNGYYDKRWRPDRIIYEGVNQELKEFIARGAGES